MSTAASTKIKPPRAANFHPFFKGMRGIARATYRQLTGLKAPDDRFPSPPSLPATGNVGKPGQQRELGKRMWTETVVERAPGRPGARDPGSRAGPQREKPQVRNMT